MKDEKQELLRLIEELARREWQPPGESGSKGGDKVVDRRHELYVSRVCFS